jgi:hypothetical protein
MYPYPRTRVVHDPSRRISWASCNNGARHHILDAYFGLVGTMRRKASATSIPADRLPLPARRVFFYCRRPTASLVHDRHSTRSASSHACRTSVLIAPACAERSAVQAAQNPPRAKTRATIAKPVMEFHLSVGLVGFEIQRTGATLKCHASPLVILALG